MPTIQYPWGNECILLRLSFKPIAFPQTTIQYMGALSINRLLAKGRNRMSHVMAVWNKERELRTFGSGGHHPFITFCGELVRFGTTPRLWSCLIKMFWCIFELNVLHEDWWRQWMRWEDLHIARWLVLGVNGNYGSGIEGVLLYEGVPPFLHLNPNLKCSVKALLKKKKKGLSTDNDTSSKKLYPIYLRLNLLTSFIKRTHTHTHTHRYGDTYNDPKTDRGLQTDILNVTKTQQRTQIYKTEQPFRQRFEVWRNLTHLF